LVGQGIVERIGIVGLALSGIEFEFVFEHVEQCLRRNQVVEQRFVARL
jgi:hypothetical protein